MSASRFEISCHTNHFTRAAALFALKTSTVTLGLAITCHLRQGELATELTTDSQPSGNFIDTVWRCNGKRSVLCARSTVCMERAVAEEAVPGVSSLAEAQELISSFRHEATRIAHVCMVARADLPDRSEKSGRQALDWYDGFTALLLELANQAADAWTRWKGRDRVRIGWLIKAARALESSFLYREMRSPSSEACGKRLQRSRRRLRLAKGQNHRAR